MGLPYYGWRSAPRLIADLAERHMEALDRAYVSAPAWVRGLLNAVFALGFALLVLCAFRGESL